MVLHGRYNQVSGPFKAGIDLLSSGGAIDLATPESTRPILDKVGIIAPPGTRIQINNSIVKISPFGVLELDQVVNIKKLIFLDDVDENALIDFVY